MSPKLRNLHEKIPPYSRQSAKFCGVCAISESATRSRVVDEGKQVKNDHLVAENSGRLTVGDSRKSGHSGLSPYSDRVRYKHTVQQQDKCSHA